MTLFTRYGRRLPIGAPPEVPEEQAVATRQAAEGFYPIPPELGAQVWSTFDTRPIGGRDFCESAPEILLPAEAINFHAQLTVPDSAVYVLRRILVQFDPQPLFLPGPDYLRLSLTRNGAPIDDADRIDHGPVFEWIETHQVYGPRETMGIIGRSVFVTAAFARVIVTFCGNRLVDQGLPTPLQVGHGVARVHDAGAPAAPPQVMR